MKKQFPIGVRKYGQEELLWIQYENEDSLLESLTKHGIRCQSDCGGRGTCGKCKIRVVKGELDITNQDQKKFAETELLQGIRLACKAYPKETCEIQLVSDEDKFLDVVVESNIGHKSNENLLQVYPDNYEDGYIIGIDLGTTTIAMGLVDKKDGRTINTYSTVNEQRAYGADVVSRMKASNEGKKELLSDTVRTQIQNGILKLLTGAGVEGNRIKDIAISGNTTMGHLFLGYSCETLGVYPFTPVNIGSVERKFHEIFLLEEKARQKDEDNLMNSELSLLSDSLREVPVRLLPGISTFVGGDIVAGLLVCGFSDSEKLCLLIDLGTNGEMAIGNKDKILVTSTAAGPAFEGVNISCGVGSIPGAISHFRINDHKASYQTIGGKAPVGICGTGVIEIASELLKAGWMDETGLLIDEYFEDGYNISDQTAKIKFTQKDIRELQLAKAAIRAGVETLIRSYGITYEQIDTVYLAGGFGYKIDVEKAVHIGLLPIELKDRINAIGNSSLAGAVQYLMEEDARDKVDKILACSKEIHLSNEEQFNELYIEAMSF